MGLSLSWGLAASGECSVPLLSCKKPGRIPTLPSLHNPIPHPQPDLVVQLLEAQHGVPPTVQHLEALSLALELAGVPRLAGFQDSKPRAGAWTAAAVGYRLASALPMLGQGLWNLEGWSAFPGSTGGVGVTGQGWSRGTRAPCAPQEDSTSFPSGVSCEAGQWPPEPLRQHRVVWVAARVAEGILGPQLWS